MRPVDRVTVQVLVDNMSDMLSGKPAHVDSELRVLMEAGACEFAGEVQCSAHHGLSLVVTVEVDGARRTVLFDAGPEAYAVERNGRNLGIRFGEIEAIALSHGHCDHAVGLPRALELIRDANGGRRVPLHVHPGAFVRRADRLPDGTLLPLQEIPPVEALERAGADVRLSAGPEEIADGLFFLSGEIPRASFERGARSHFRLRADGEWEPDPLIMDERFTAVHVRDRGLVLFTGCSHAGIVNIVSYARALFPGIPVYGIAGGLHLVYPNEDLIEPTIHALRELPLGAILAGHCTGWRALHRLVDAFGDEVVTPLAVGTRYRL